MEKLIYQSTDVNIYSDYIVPIDIPVLFCQNNGIHIRWINKQNGSIMSKYCFKISDLSKNVNSLT